MSKQAVIILVIISILGPQFWMEAKILPKNSKNKSSTNTKKKLETCPNSTRLQSDDFDPALTDSVILSGKPSWRKLLKAWIGGTYTTFKLCWRATRDGKSGRTFHAKCKGKKPTLTIAQSWSYYTFGGYATASWDGSGYKKAPGSFIFSLRNYENLAPFKAPLKDQNSPHAIYNYNFWGPTFGSGWDINISYLRRTGYSATLPGRNYQMPLRVGNRFSILAGPDGGFRPTEVEVFYLE